MSSTMDMNVEVSDASELSLPTTERESLTLSPQCAKDVKVRS